MEFLYKRLTVPLPSFFTFTLPRHVYLQDDDDRADRCVITDGSQVRSLLEERRIIGSNHVDYQLSLGTELLQRLVVRCSHLHFQLMVTFIRQ